MDRRKRRIRDVFGSGGGGGGGEKLPRFEPEQSLFDKTLDCNTLAVVIENMSVRQIANFAATNQHVAHCMKQLAEQSRQNQKIAKIVERFDLVGLVNARERSVQEMTEKFGNPPIDNNAPTQLEFFTIIFEKASRPLQNVFTPQYPNPEINVIIKRFLNLGRNVFLKVMEFWFTLPMRHVSFAFARPFVTMENPLTTVQKFHVGAVIMAAFEVYESTTKADCLNEKQYELLWTLGFVLDFLNIRYLGMEHFEIVFLRPLKYRMVGKVASKQFVPAFNKAVKCIIDNRDLAHHTGQTPDEVSYIRLHELLISGAMNFADLDIDEDDVEFMNADANGNQLQEYCDGVRQRFGPEHAQAMSAIRMDDRKINEAVAKTLPEYVLTAIEQVRPLATLVQVRKRLQEMKIHIL